MLLYNTAPALWLFEKNLILKKNRLQNARHSRLRDRRSWQPLLAVYLRLFNTVLIDLFSVTHKPLEIA